MTRAEGHGDIIRVEDHGATTTLMVFAHRDAPGFAFQGVTADLPVNRILVRDPTERGWYNQGLGDLGFTLEEIATNLARIVRALSTKRLLTLGSSMGGYAAILFGLRLRAERVLAFNPQTLLDPLFPLSPPPNMVRQAPDLRDELKGSGCTGVDIVIAEEDCADLFHAAWLCGHPCVSVSVIPDSTHLVTEELNDAGRLKPLIAAWVALEAAPGEAAACFAQATFRAAVVQAVPAFLRGDYPACIAPLALVEAAYPRHAGVPHLRGCALFETGRFAEAALAQSQALRRRPGWSNAADHLAKAIARQNRHAI